MSDRVRVEVKRRKIHRRHGRFAWYWHYYGEADDGARFDNSSIVTLRQVLRRKYGRTVRIVETWKAAAR